MIGKIGENNQITKQIYRQKNMVNKGPTIENEPEANRKNFWYSDFTNRPNQKSNGSTLGDSANLDTTSSVISVYSVFSC